MLHPIFSVLITRPELVMEHAAGYAALMREEASSVGLVVAKRAIAWGVTLFASLVFLILLGVAAMLGANVVPVLSGRSKITALINKAYQRATASRPVPAESMTTMSGSLLMIMRSPSRTIR